MSRVAVVLVLLVCGHCLGLGPDDLPPRYQYQPPVPAGNEVHKPSVFINCMPGNSTNASGKKTYELSTFKLNWFEAFNYCLSQNQRMATFETKYQYDELVAEITKSKAATHVWVGANDLGREGHFFWMSTGRPLLGFRKWGEGNPDNASGGEHCVFLWNNNGDYVMNDFFCSSENYFVCEQ